MSDFQFPSYDTIGVRPLINCRGYYTIISGSLLLPEVRAAMAAASGATSTSTSWPKRSAGVSPG